MIRHIFKKDLALLWPYIAAVAALQLVRAAAVITLGLFNQPRALQLFWQASSLIFQAALAVLIVLAVQQDSMQGTRQDWLGRPVKRRDLLLAKLLFVAVAIFGPVFAAEALIAATHGFSAGTVVAAAFAASLSQFITVGLPVLILASLTGTLLEALAGLLLAWLLTYALGFVNLSVDLLNNLTVNLSTLWQQMVLKDIVIIAGAAIILPLQYFQRRTLLLRGVFAAGLLLAMGVSQFPKSAAFAIERRLSPDPGFAPAVSIGFDASLGPFTSGGSEGLPSDPIFYLPLKVAGLPQGAMLTGDRFVVTLTDLGGNVLYRDTPVRNMSDETNHDGDPGLRLRLADADRGTVRLHQGFRIPLALYTRIKSMPVRVRIDYSLTVLKQTVTATIPAIGGRKVIPGLGLCASRRRVSYFGDIDDNIDVYCYRTADSPDCTTSFVRDRQSGQRDPVQELCYGLNYEPQILRVAELDRPGQTVASYRFMSRALPSEPYPVGIDRVAQSDLMLTGYAPQVHYTRSLVTSPIRLGDWAIRIVPHMPRRILQ